MITPLQAKNQQDAVAKAMAILNEDLGTLPENLAKIFRAGIATGPTAPAIAVWCEMNRAAANRIVGAVATIAAARMNT